MARKATQNIDLALRGKDFGAYATLSRAKTATTSLGPAFASANSSMAAFGAASSVMGGRVATASSMVSQFAGVLGKGGAFGLAIAGAAIGIGAVTRGLFGIVTSAADAGDQIFDLSRRFGISVETMSRLKFVADQNGASAERLGNAFKTLSRNAVTGTAQFRKWGLSLQDSNGNLRSSEDLFFAAIKRLNELENSNVKTAAAQDLFGRSGAELLQVVHLGEDGIRSLMERADELGVTMGTHAAVSANQFNNSLGQLSDTTSALKREVGDGLLPQFESYIRIATDVVNWVRQMRGEFSGLLSIMQPLKAVWDYNVAVIDKVADELGYTADVASDAAAMEKNLEEQLDSTSGAVDRQITKVKSARNEWKAYSSDISAAIAAQLRVEDEASKRTQDLFATHDKWLNEWAQNSLDMRIQRSNEEVELEEANTKKRIENTRLWEDTQRSAAMGAANALSNGFQQMILDSDNAGVHMIRAVVDAAQAAVLSYAASAAAAAAFSQAGIPILGPVLAAASAATVFGLVKGFLSTIPSYQSGGVVPGPNNGRDDRLVLAHGGEVYYSRNEHDEMLALMRGKSGGGLTLQVNTVLPPDSTQMTKQVRALQFHQRRLRRQRVI
jgi:hypothetical protein